MGERWPGGPARPGTGDDATSMGRDGRETGSAQAVQETHAAGSTKDGLKAAETRWGRSQQGASAGVPWAGAWQGGSCSFMRHSASGIPQTLTFAHRRPVAT